MQNDYAHRMKNSKKKRKGGGEKGLFTKEKELARKLQ